VIIVGTAKNGREAIEKTRQLRPEIIVMDLTMPECGGLEATRAIKAGFPEVKILVLTVSEREADLIEAIRSGASGFLLKGMDANEFCDHLAALAAGETILPAQIAAQVIASAAPNGRPTDEPPTSEPLTLSERQQQILNLVALGMTYKEVGAALHLSEQSIKYHMGQILDQLHLENRAQAIAFVRHGKI